MCLGHGQRTRGHTRRKLVVADRARDLLDEILGDRDVGAYDGWPRDERVAVAPYIEAEAFERAHRVGRRDGDPQMPVDLREGQADVGRRPRGWVAADDPRVSAAGGPPPRAAGGAGPPGGGTGGGGRGGAGDQTRQPIGWCGRRLRGGAAPPPRQAVPAATSVTGRS